MGVFIHRGSGDQDHLGHGDRGHSNRPQLVESLAEKKVISVAVGPHNCLALTASGELYGWGKDIHGEAEETLSQPTLIPEASKQGVFYLSCGAHEVCRRVKRREEGRRGGWKR